MLPGAGDPPEPRGTEAGHAALRGPFREATNGLFTEARREFEKRFIARVLQRHRGNLSRAAKDLKIHRNTLGKKIEEYKL